MCDYDGKVDHNSRAQLFASVSIFVRVYDFTCCGKRQTPTSKGDCIALSQALYRKAESLSKRTKQIIPREFARVAANLDEFCGEENFEKARISIDWINTCLKNFAKDYKLGFCSRNKNYFCAVFPQSEGCLQSQ